MTVGLVGPAGRVGLGAEVAGPEDFCAPTSKTQGASSPKSKPRRRTVHRYCMEPPKWSL